MIKANLLCVVLAVCLSLGCASSGTKSCCVTKGDESCCAASGPVLRHVVMFGFTADTTPDQVKEFENAFRTLSTKVPGIIGFEWGTNVSPENKNQGLTHCFFLTFRTQADRDAYLPHPEHDKFKALLKGHVEKVCVLDYWAQK